MVATSPMSSVVENHQLKGASIGTRLPTNLAAVLLPLAASQDCAITMTIEGRLNGSLLT